MLTSKDYLNALGIQCWEQRKSASVPSRSSLNLDQLQQEVAQCVKCSLSKTRTQTVFGVGNSQAKLMLIGEAPGFHEDKQGKPFVGPAGQLLTAMLKAIGLTREEVFIANILKCRPPNNRDPAPNEVAECTPYLQQQINLIKPKLLLALGRIAAHHLLQMKSSMDSLRGKIYSYGEEKIPLLVTYHPAYLLRSPHEKRKAWIDLQMVQKMLG